MARGLAVVLLSAALVSVTAISLGSGPHPTSAFTLLGSSLDLDQRGFRVNNNFADAEANDNTTPHPNYPGHTGAVMALWKAHSEWASVPHGDGSGDPLDDNVLGSGGANFDNTFGGTTTDFAGNVHRAVSIGGAVIAFTTVGRNGWIINYNDDFVWDDGPGAPGVNAIDLQAVATHEIGYTLGLGNSAAPGATMMPALASSTGARSIEADDIAGLQAIYGIKAATKPQITSLSGSQTVGGTLVIAGSHFSPTGNDVWFTKTASDGVPTKVSGLPSSAGGTQLSVPIPADAADGDVLVKGVGMTGASLSNAWPLDLVDGAAFVDLGPGLAGAAGAPLLRGDGDLTPGTGSMELAITGVAASAPGIWFIGLVEGAVPLEGGVLYAFPWLVSVNVRALPDGTITVAGAVPVGSSGLSIVTQLWFLDATGPFGATATNGLRLDIP
jgi:hypothetical protein